MNTYIDIFTCKINGFILFFLFQVFTNIYRHRVKLLACGLLVMISLLCYILKNHDVNANFNVISKGSKENMILNENMAHVIRHHRVLNKRPAEVLKQNNDEINDNNNNNNNNNNNDLNLNNIEITSFNKRKRKNMLSARTVEKSHVDLVEFYKKNELYKNSIINQINIHNKTNNLNQVPANYLVNQDESHLNKLPIFRQEKTQDNFHLVGNNMNMMNMHNNMNRNIKNFMTTDDLTVEQSLKSLERIVHIDLKVKSFE